MRRKQGLTLGQALVAFLTQLPKMANQSRLTSICSNSPFSWNSHLSMNRSICDSRCSGFPVELEHSHIAIARGLMHISLSIAPRPSPDHMRRLSFDQGIDRLCDDKAKTPIPKRQAQVDFSVTPAVLRPMQQSTNFHLKFTVSLGRTGNGSKEGVLR